MVLPLTVAAGMAAPLVANVVTQAADKLLATAQDFETVFLNSMFQEMFTGIDGEGPFGSGAGTGVWRSFLTEEYAKTFSQAGGVGIADHVYRTLIDHQAAAR